MWSIFKRLFLGFFLIAVTSGVLLLSDAKSRRTGDRNSTAASPQTKVFHVALVLNASQSILEQGAQGMLEGLAEKGFADGQRIAVKKYNAEGDMPTLAAIAKEITDGKYDLILTVSTPALQAVANANKAGKTLHVFALVSDPYGAGVGISRENHLDHPRHMAGFGTMQPVEASLRLARQMRPELKTVGVVWNPAEANSEACTKRARKVCEELGITLLESTVDNSAGVLESANALVARGVEALWIGGDNTVLVAVDSMIQAGRQGKIPVFTVIPPHAERGALFDVGADYHEVGRLTGNLAAEILSGRESATVAIENVVPEMLLINQLVVKNLKDNWRLPPELLEKANVLIDAQGKHAKAKSVKASAPVSQIPTPLTKKWQIRVVEFNQVLDVEESEQGFLEGLKKSGLVAGKDYEVKVTNAQGDMATVNSLVDAALADGADMLVTLSTPTLQVAIRRANKIPVVFTYCANAITAGAGRNEEDHLPNITGVQTTGAYDDLILAVHECLPKARTIGTLFVPSEVNMVYHRDKIVAEAKKYGLEVISMGAETTAEVPDAATALCHRNIDAICQIPGNLTAAAFPSIARAAQTAKIPLFASQSSQAHGGAAVVLCRDYHEASLDTAALAVRIMRGENPAKIPIQTFSRTKLIVNPAGAKACGLTLPVSILKRADQIIGEPVESKRPRARLDLNSEQIFLSTGTFHPERENIVTLNPEFN